MFQGKMKAVTFSYDDGVTQDQRLIKLFDRYNLKCTFNLNSGCLGMPGSLVREDVTVAHVKPRAQEVRKIYAGHEIAAHTLTHPMLPLQSDEEIIRQVEQDRLALSEIAGYEVVGMAYPGGGQNHDERVVRLVKEHTKIRYARTILSSHSFDLQSDLFVFRPTVYHHKEWETMERLADEFLSLDAQSPAVFYIWGHAYEFDIGDTWDAFEAFLKKISFRSDIFYGTNKEVLLSK